MNRTSRRLLAMFASTALTTCGGVAFAQQAQTTGPEDLSEVVVTATKQSDVISRVPMTITAETQKSLDQLNIKSAQDLNRVVPSLVITGNGATGSNISIRGIRSTVAGGAATTGVYLDDTALQSRTLSGIASGAGAFLPPLFDIERVEVLKGPQGTLYGGSSEGGTIRFLSPAPSVRDYSVYAKGEINSVDQGSMGYTAGVAVGGPIVKDVLGFRASVYDNHIGGWVDHVDRNNNGAVLPNGKDTNQETQKALRLAFLWQPNDRAKITPSVYMGYDKKADGDTVYVNVPQYTVPTRYYTISSAGTFTRLGGPIAGATPGGAVPGGTYAVSPGYSVGPYNYLSGAKYDSLVNDLVGGNFAGQNQAQPDKTPRTSTLFLPSLTLEYNFDHMQVKSISSYFNDRAKGVSQLTMQEPVSNAQAGPQSGDGSTLGTSPFPANVPFFNGLYYYHNARSGISEELRASSANSDSRLTWVGGVYFTSSHEHSYAYDAEDTNALYLGMFGVPESARFSTAIAGRNFVGQQDQSDRESKLNETDMAAFGEINFAITPKLKVTAGVRVDRNELNYYTAGGGLQSVPSSVSGTTVDSPVTPKFSISYQATADDLFYATAAKGYRPGGVNAPITLGGRCDTDLNTLGITSTPATFDSDTVWSYEGGAKVRTFDKRLSVAGSIYYIEWNKPQISFTLPTCVASYTTNAGTAVSKGFDLQGNFRILPGLSSNFSTGYTDAYYPDAILGPKNAATGVSATLVNKGDWQIGVPRWQATFGMEYDFHVIGDHNAYLRADYQYIGRQANSLGPGTTGYAPDAQWINPQTFLNMRLGMALKGFDLSVFADNLLGDSKFSPSSLSGRSGCAVATGAACSLFSSYYYVVSGSRPRPRVVGVTAIYKY